MREVLIRNHFQHQHQVAVSSYCRICPITGPAAPAASIRHAWHLNSDELKTMEFVSCSGQNEEGFDSLLQRCPSVTRRAMDEALRSAVVLPENDEVHGVAATVSQEQQHHMLDAEEKERQTRRRLRAISARLHETNTGNVRRQHQMELHMQRFVHYQQRQQQQYLNRAVIGFANALSPVIVACE